MAIRQVNLPGVYGAAQQYKTGQLQNQLQQLQLQEGQQAIETRNALKPLLPKAAQGDKEALGQVMSLSPETGMQFQEHVAKMTAAQREQWQFEAPLVARAMSGAKDQATYAAALNSLGNAGVDISDLPNDFSPDAISSMVALGQEAENFTLSPGQTRFGPDGQPLAALPAAPERPTTAVQEYQQAVAQGFEGTFLDYKTALAKAGKPETNVTVGGGKYGTIPPGWELIEGPDGASMRPIAGGPVAQKIEAEARAAAEQEGVKLQTEAGKAETMLDATGSIKGIMEGANTPVTGTSSRPFAMHSGTPAGQVRSYVGTLKSGVALGAIQRLKEASATGATGFGAMNEAELQLLIDDIGALDPDTTEPEIFMKTIDRIERRYKRVAEDIKANVSSERIKELSLEPLLASAGGAGKSGGAAGGELDFSSMSVPDLIAVDETKLNSEQLDAYVKALQGAGK